MDTDYDGVCDHEEVSGCQDTSACNYDADATNSGYCDYADAGYNCDGACVNDADGDGVCDEDELPGCTDATACNYDCDATEDDGSCAFAATGYTCAGVCLSDADGDCICDEFETAGCQDATACNFDPFVTDDDGSCAYAESGYDCDGNCLFDVDGDGVCDQDEVTGCQDSAACNYDDAATDPGYCDYATAYFDCAGECINDADGNGICDEFEVGGDPTCINDLNELIEALQNGNYCGSGTVWVADLNECVAASECFGDLDGDGNRGTEDLLQLLSVYGTLCPIAFGCTDSMAENYDPAAEVDDGTCVYAADACNNEEALEYGGYAYELVAIEGQCWFAENLRTQFFSNGDEIPLVSGSFDWYQAGTGSQPSCAWVNGNELNTNQFGLYYNGFAAFDARGLCPSGWHVGLDEDWMVLEAHLGMDDTELTAMGDRGTDQGEQLKSTSLDDPEWDGTNTVLFDAVASGQRFNFGSNNGFGLMSLLWTGSNSGSSTWCRKLEGGNAQIERALISNAFGGIVRCIKDTEE